MSSTSEFTGLPASPPMVVVISGPSGVGKTVICARLVAGDPLLVHSVSATTRSPRDHEKNGEDYFFWTEERFRAEDEQGAFLESAVVHGSLYATPKKAVEASLARGRSPVLNVDVQGGRSVKRLMPGALLILITPPSMEDLEKRLRGRGTDSEEEIRERLANAARELGEWEHYDYALANDVLDDSVARVRGILGAERARVDRLRGRI